MSTFFVFVKVLSAVKCLSERVAEGGVVGVYNYCDSPEVKMFFKNGSLLICLVLFKGSGHGNKFLLLYLN